MKPENRSPLQNGLLLLAAAVAILSPTLRADTIHWWNAGTDFNSGSSWVEGLVPGAGDIATFTGPALANPNLSAPATVLGLAFTNSSASGYAFSGNPLTLGRGGIDASAVTSGTNSITSNLTIGSGAQVWQVGAGATLALSTGTFS